MQFIGKQVDESGRIHIASAFHLRAKHASASFTGQLRGSTGKFLLPQGASSARECISTSLYLLGYSMNSGSGKTLTNRTETKKVPWRDGVLFYTKRWIPVRGQTLHISSPRALIIFIHGFAEHVERWNHVWSLFAERHIEVFGFDQRGFGQSGPRYGDTTLGRQLQDIEFAIDQERKRLDGLWGKDTVPIYLYGHSMGGGEVITFFTRPFDAKGPSQKIKDMVAGVICSAPWIISTSPPPKVIVGLADTGSRLWPWPYLPLRTTLARNQLATDPTSVEEYKRDPLVSGGSMLKTVVGPLVGGYKILSKEFENWPSKLPILIQHGEKDPATSPKASRAFIDKIECNDKEHKLWLGVKHEGHNDPGASKAFVEYAIRWIEDRTVGPGHARL